MGWCVANPARMTILPKGALAGWLICGMVSGCATSQGPAFLTIQAEAYADAFDAAVEAAAVVGLTPIVRDRRSGVIETEPSIAGSVLEPWRNDNASFAQAIENTITFQRRRARFEFTPGGFRPREAAEASLTGPDLFATQDAEVDMTRHPGPLELRVWVYVERAYSPGLRRSTWTRAKTTRSRIVPTQDDEALPRRYWTPVRRDEAYERRLLAAVERALGEWSEASSDGPDGKTVAATKP
ncbi:MAG: hypothetical protein V3T84_03550 [Phycisphaerales bacterium]